MPEQDPEFTDEMISDYLDGELSDSEHEFVERIVEGDPQYRRMLEELQALRDRIKSLPQFQLDGEFHQRVLRVHAVEQTKPSPGSGSGRTPSAESAGRPVWRRLAWLGATMAAGLLLMFFLPEIDKMGQVSQNVQQAAEDRASADVDPSVDEQPPGEVRLSETEALRSEGPAARVVGDESPTPREVPAPRETEQQGISPSVADSASVAEAIKPRGATPQPLGQEKLLSQKTLATENSPFGVANDGGTPESGVDSPIADDLDPDAIVYCGKAAGGTDAAERRLYRMSGDGANVTFGRARAEEVTFGRQSEPQFLIVEGSPDQIALSLSRIELTDSPDQPIERILSESMTESFAEGSPGGGRPVPRSDDDARKLDQDRLRRSSDQYIDLNAADTNSVVVNRVERESADYQRLLGLIAAKSPRARAAMSNAVDDVQQPAAAPNLSEANSQFSNGSRSQLNRSLAAEATDRLATARARRQTARPSSGHDESQILFYSLAPNFARQASRDDREQASLAGGVTGSRALVEELKGITPKSEDGTLRVLLVLPAAEGAANPGPQPAVSETAEPPAAETQPANDPR